MKTITVKNESYEFFKLIRKSRPQDSNNADTFEYVLKVYRESPLKVTEEYHPLKTAGSASPIIDADKLQNSSFIKREKDLAPTKNNAFVQLGEVKKP